MSLYSLAAFFGTRPNGDSIKPGIGGVSYGPEILPNDSSFCNFEDTIVLFSRADLWLVYPDVGIAVIVDGIRKPLVKPFVNVFLKSGS